MYQESKKRERTPGSWCGRGMVTVEARFSKGAKARSNGTGSEFPRMPAMISLAQPQQRQFNPYSENGGTILAVAGADFSVIAGDTRQSEGYSIQTRYAPKVFRLTDKAVLAVNGFAADGNMFVKKVRQRLEWYRHAHAKDMPLRAIARLIQTMLYARRFFPFYVYNILGGIEDDGTGAVYSFDPVGSYEREACRAAGAAQSLVQPFLDNQIYFKNQTPAPGTSHPVHLPLSTVLSLVIDSFTSATERHIEVGDGLEMYVVLAKGSTALQSIVSVRGIQEMTTTEDGERVFVIRRELKKD
ncbi:hypothetical protein D9615_002762 [Tricholomella constricta]|uniref:Proteasome subunit beta n=1 Tax=Tricholomella constricta TaxID=117010 RepID=A0A8H5HG27_9AGAR|nr:hypothetical protein D9615_002762 [Tricholomella constricta]